MYSAEKYEIKNENDFINLEMLWHELQKGGEMTVFQTYDWNKLLFQEWIRQFASSLVSSVFVYVIYNENIPVLIAPLIIQKLNTKTKWFGRKRGIYILGYGSYSDYMNFVYKEFDGKSVQCLIEHIHKDFSNMKFFITDLPEWVGTMKVLNEMQVEEIKSSVAVAVKIEEKLDAYNAKISKNTRQNLRTARNRMKKNNISYEIEVLRDVHDNKLLEELRTIHIERMTRKNLKNSDWIHFISSRIRVYFRRRNEMKNNIIFQSMQHMRQSVLVIVRLNGDIAGYLYGLEDNKTVRIMQNCFKKEYSFYSPLFLGAYDYIAMQYELIHPVEWVDFTRGNEDYKYKLAGVETKLHSFSISCSAV